MAHLPSIEKHVGKAQVSGEECYCNGGQYRSAFVQTQTMEKHIGTVVVSRETCHCSNSEWKSIFLQWDDWRSLLVQ